ncbi:hypothetical protein RSPO_c03152 [Ralstonia solanacearum Po82]|uniref:Uncharacterized protein n=1 Tax=Ralstonia solanacearum (strain Po82) TaxID=1031711 RepID=F6G4I1_RALS8|nr:hypothetical protein RSPO_c03152 [Ralstonia solanacearum Po82]
MLAQSRHARRAPGGLRPTARRTPCPARTPGPTRSRRPPPWSMARGGVRDRSYNRKRTPPSAPTRQETPCPPPSTCQPCCNT